MSDPNNPPRVVWPFGRLTLLSVARKVTELAERLAALEGSSEIRPDPGDLSPGPMRYEAKERRPGWWDVFEVTSGTKLNTQAMRRGDAEHEARRQNAALEGFDVPAHDPEVRDGKAA